MAATNPIVVEVIIQGNKLSVEKIVQPLFNNEAKLNVINVVNNVSFSFESEICNSISVTKL
jgi:hypothetical protein